MIWQFTHICVRVATAAHGIMLWVRSSSPTLPPLCCIHLFLPTLALSPPGLHGKVRQGKLKATWPFLLPPFCLALSFSDSVPSLKALRCLTLLPVSFSSFTLAAWVLNHFNFSFWSWRLIQVPFFSALIWGRVRWCDWRPGREIQYNYFQVEKPSRGKKGQNCVSWRIWYFVMSDGNYL